MQPRSSLTVSVAKLVETCQIVPWESFQGLRSLTYRITFSILRPQLLLGGDADQSTTIFSGPSRLPQLQDLHVVHHNRPSFGSITSVSTPIDIIYLRNLNKSIEDPGSFPCLRTFRAEVKCTVIRTLDEPPPLDKDKLFQLVVDRLPAVFRSGGRRDTHGWTATIVPNVRTIV